MTLKKTLNFLLLVLSITCIQFVSFSALADSNTNKLIRLATTTSTDNSGLLKYLIPKFESDSGYKIHVIAVGTGKALQMGRDGDVDLMLVHAKSAEEDFIANGYGQKRHPVMYNDFVIVGPKEDIPSFSSMGSIQEVLKKIAQNKSRFISRGDDSGTHKKELSLWKTVDNMPNKKSDHWYIEAGQGMGKVLQMTGEMGAYTMTDRGTWLAFMNKLPLSIIFEGNPKLLNPYGIIAVNPDKHPHVNNKGANDLIHWITSEKGQQLIGEFKISDQVLFTPNALTMAKK